MDVINWPEFRDLENASGHHMDGAATSGSLPGSMYQIYFHTYSFAGISGEFLSLSHTVGVHANVNSYTVLLR